MANYGAVGRVFLLGKANLIPANAIQGDVKCVGPFLPSGPIAKRQEMCPLPESVRRPLQGIVPAPSAAMQPCQRGPAA